MNELVRKQLAIDFCCKEEDVDDNLNHFTEHTFLAGRRRFKEKEEVFLKVAVVNGKVLFSGKPEILSWCKNEYEKKTGEWFFEAKNMRKLNDKLHEYGYQIAMAHPFFISEKASEVDTKDFEIKYYRGKEIEQFRGDDRYDEAYSFCEEAPDVIGVSAIKDGKILGMAGASADSDMLWQIGINVDPSAGHAGIGKMLVALLKNEILKEGRLPYYGTGFSHLASQRVALSSGFVPTWVELVTERINTGE
jgi:hypothetical protein